MRLGKFSEAFHCNISEITADQINEFLRNLKSKGRSRNNYRRVIGTLIRFAEIKAAVPRGQIQLRDIDRVSETSCRRQVFTPDEMVKLLKAAQCNPENLKPGFNKRYARDQGLLPLLILGGFAGMRTNAEIRRQKWSDINLETGFITVTGAKGGTAADRLIPISDNLRHQSPTNSRFNSQPSSTSLPGGTPAFAACSLATGPACFP
jgi:integrase